MLTDEHIAKLSASKTEKEWNTAVAAIKREFGGDYPENWYVRVIATGLARKVAANWGGTDEIKVY